MEFSDEYVPLVLNEFVGGKLDITTMLKKYWWALLVVISVVVIYYKNNASTSTGTSLSVEIVNGEEKIVKKVDGKEVEVTEEDRQKIEAAKATAQDAVANANELSTTLGADIQEQVTNTINEVTSEIDI